MSARPRLGAVLRFALALIVAASACGRAMPGRSDASVPPGGAAVTVFGDRLAFGLRNDPDDLGWMTRSGVPWAARYTYLAGGVNTGAGWATWGATPGTYASEYAKQSALAGYIPVFSYYQLQQSLPRKGATEAERDLGNLADAATMRAYYADFRALLRSLAPVETPVVVHVEPDLWGYLEQRSGSAASIAASVRGSGDADIENEPDNAIGFAHALLDLRDRYAPNVLLAIHASAWAAGPDPVVSTATFDPVPLANRTATFLRSLDRPAHGWDLVFHDMVDRDAALAPITKERTLWWDATDRAVPNFARWLAFVHALSVGLDRRIVVWQVPLGNQRFRTMDDTPGHYQDNRAEYFLSHADALAAAGVAAVLFGPGIEDATMYTDARHDGVTNPPPVEAPGCDRCNTELASYADDDGGYIRLAVGAYYRNGPVALPTK